MMALDSQLVLKWWTLYFYGKQQYIKTWKKEEEKELWSKTQDTDQYMEENTVG